MKLIKPKFEHIPLLDYEEGIIVNIEQAARTCYKSEEKFNAIFKIPLEDDMALVASNNINAILNCNVEQAISGRKLLKNTIIDRGHLAVLEFGYHPIFEISYELFNNLVLDAAFYNYLEDTKLDINQQSTKFFNFSYDEINARFLMSGSIRCYRDYFKWLAINVGINTEELVILNLLMLNYKFFFEDFPNEIKIVNSDEPKFDNDKLTDSELITRLVKQSELTLFEQQYHIYEHYLLTCDRGVSHELVRHRPVGFAQESTRYCNYGKDEHVQFIIPCFTTIIEDTILPSNFKWTDSIHTRNECEWLYAMENSEESYNMMIKEGWTPQQARSILPNSLKTEINMIANLQEWHHIFIQRTSKAAHPQMRELMIPMLKEFQSKYPNIFNDIKID